MQEWHGFLNKSIGSRVRARRVKNGIEQENRSHGSESYCFLRTGRMASKIKPGGVQ